MNVVVKSSPLKPENEGPEKKPRPVLAKQPTLSDSLNEAKHLVNGLDWPIFKRLAVITLLVVFFIAIYLGLILFMGIDAQTQSWGDNYLMKMVGVLFGMLINIVLIQMIMMGVRQSIGLPLYLEKINAQCLSVKWDLLKLLVYLEVLNFMMAYLPTKSLIFGGTTNFFVNILVYWIVFTPVMLFAIPEVITKKQSAYTAVVNAYINAWHDKKKIAISYGLLFIPYYFAGAFYIIAKLLIGNDILVFALSTLLVLVISLWLFPLGIALGGVLFRDAYGLKART